MSLKDPSLLRQAALVGTRWIEADASGIAVKNPATGELVGHVPKLGAKETKEAIDAAAEAQKAWAARTAKERSAVLRKWFDLMIENKDDLGRILTMEQGKPLAEATGEIVYGASFVEWFAEEARRVYGDIMPGHQKDKRILVMKQPIGVVAAITPWNFPNAMITRKAGPAFAAGCAMVLKPASQTPFSAIALAILAERAGLPAGLFSVITGSAREIGAEMTANPTIRKLTFTGSTEIGAELYRQCAPTIKKLGLELGGKNPIIVFADSDLEDAADGAAFGISFNTGQCCVSSSRLIVERSVAAEFETLLAEKMAKIRVGDPLDEATQVGAITTEAQNTTILDYIAKGKAAGARLLAGGGPVDLGRGQYIAPTLFSGVSRDMAIARDEIFGPVLCSMHFDTVEEAIQLANDTVYGLAASVWTKNIDKALTVSRRVRAGRFWVNTIMAGGPEMPLGGFKQSGWGREAGMYGVEEYTQVKSIHVEIGKRTHWIA